MPNLSFLSFGFSRPNDTPLALAAAPVFTNTSSSASIFNRPSLDVPPQEFTFGAGRTPHNSGLNISTNIPAVNDFSMDGSWLVGFRSYMLLVRSRVFRDAKWWCSASPAFDELNESYHTSLLWKYIKMRISLFWIWLVFIFLMYKLI